MVTNVVINWLQLGSFSSLLSTKFSFHRSVRKQLTISTALAGAILSGYGARKSYAGDCSGGPNMYTCSGAATGGDTAQILSGAPLTVTTTSGFGISTGTGTAFDLTGSNGLEFNDSYGSDITGATFGIDAGNTTNSLSITTTGHVEGVSGYGIYANNSGIDLTINAASVTGNYDGINAANNGSGVLSITTTGHVEGASDDGIFAINRGTNLTINAASATGRQDGIHARNLGSGALSVTASGFVQGTTGYGDGIYSVNNLSGTDLTINAADVTGEYRGIQAVNLGSGALSVTASGTVEGTRDDGLIADNSRYGTELTVDATAVTGGEDGIWARNRGTGGLSITATGDVTGASRYGISATNQNGTNLTISAANVTGHSVGLVARSYGTGYLSINTTDGTVTGDYGPGLVATSFNGTNLTVTTADVSGASTAMYVRNFGTGNLSIDTTSGTVEGSTVDGIVTQNYGTDLTIETAGVSGSQKGIYGINTGSGIASVTTTGVVTGSGNVGVFVYNTGTNLTIDASGAVTGYSDAIAAINQGSGALSITSAAATATNYDGIYARNYGTDLTVVANGAVSGGDDGISANNYGTGATSVTTHGTVNGVSDEGIDVYNGVNGTSLAIIANGDVTAYQTGIQANNYGSAGLSITANGDVTSQTVDGIYGYNSANDVSSSMVINQAAGTTTTGARDGIYSVNYGGSLTINANGTTVGQARDGINAYNGLIATDLTINAADASGDESGIYAINIGTGNVTVTSTGVVSGSKYSGVFVYNTGTDLTIDASGAVSGYYYGVSGVNRGSGALSITTAAATATHYDGVFARNFGTDLTVVTNGTVSGADDGISANNYGTGAVSVTTHGTVDGIDDEGIDVENSAAGTSLTIVASDDVAAYQSGIQAINYGTEGLSITANGDVTSQSADGVNARNFGSDVAVVANGTVSGGIHGIAARNLGSGTLSITTAAVTGSSGNGIIARNYGTSLTIVSNGDVNAELMGIRAKNYGTGGVSITANGNVTSQTAHGIYGYNSANDVNSSMVITQAVGTTTTGAANGIYSLNYGGSLTINANGTTVGQSRDGINAYNGTTATDLTIDAMTVTGSVDGIDATNYGSGVMSVTVGGSVQGGSGVGIQTITNLGGTTLMVVENGAIIGATSNEAISNNEGDSDLTFNSGSAVNGAVRLNDGSDVLTVIAGADVSNPMTVLDGGDDSSIADGYIDQLYLSGTRTLTGANIINWENVIVTGGTVNFSDNALTVGADNGYGLVIQSGGTLVGGSAFALTGNLEIASGGTFSAAGGGAGVFSTSGSLANRGTLSLADGAAGDSFTVNGDFVGGGVLDLDVDQASQTADTLIIAGDVTGGTTTITVNGFAEDGNDTDILLVDVTGTSDTSDFAMTSIVDGAFAIGLEQASNDWYLRNIGFSPNTPIYQTYPQVLLSFSDLLSFHDRFGDPWGNALGANASNKGVVSRNSLGGPIFDTGPEMWGYLNASHSHVETSSSTVPTTYDLTRWSMRTGYKSEGIGYGNGQLVLGASFHYGKADASITSAIGGGSVDAEALGFGVSATWIGDGGFYADGQLEGNSFSTDLSSDTLGSLVSDNSGHGYTASLEVGKRFALDDVWSITPQGQVTHSQVYFDAFTSSQGTAVSGQDGSATELRIGAAFDRHQTHTDGAQSHLFGITNIYVDTASGTAVNVASTTFYDSLEKYSAEIGLGGSYSKNGGLTNLYGSLTARTGLENFGQSYAYTAKIGVAFQF